MRALSLWQPWASAVALGHKQIETRSWRTPYRGPLAIHSARTKTGVELAMQGAGHAMAWRQVFWHHNEGLRSLFLGLPYGAILATCELVDCVPVEQVVQELLLRQADGGGWLERQLGDYRAGRWAWILANVRPLAVALPWTGRQGLFEVDIHETSPAAAAPQGGPAGGLVPQQGDHRRGQLDKAAGHIPEEQSNAETDRR